MYFLGLSVISSLKRLGLQLGTSSDSWGLPAIAGWPASICLAPKQAGVGNGAQSCKLYEMTPMHWTGRPFLEMQTTLSGSGSCKPQEGIMCGGSPGTDVLCGGIPRDGRCQSSRAAGCNTCLLQGNGDTCGECALVHRLVLLTGRWGHASIGHLSNRAVV